MEKNKVIDFEIFRKNKDKETERKALIDIIKVGEFIDVKSIKNGIVDYYEFAAWRMGLVIGYDFILIDDDPQVYPINLEMGEGIFYPDDDPMIYVKGLNDIESIDSDSEQIEEVLELAKKCEKWYFEEYLTNELARYDCDYKTFYELEELSQEVIKKSDPKCGEVIEFKPRKK